MSDIVIATKNTNELKRDIIQSFYTYVNHKFGSNIWDELLKIEQFQHMMEIYYSSKNIKIFSTLIDITSAKLYLPIHYILSDFSDFIKS